MVHLNFASSNVYLYLITYVTINCTYSQYYHNYLGIYQVIKPVSKYSTDKRIHTQCITSSSSECRSKFKWWRFLWPMVMKKETRVKLIGEARLDKPFAVHLGTVLNFTKWITWCQYKASKDCLFENVRPSTYTFIVHAKFILKIHHEVLTEFLKNFSHISASF